VALVIDRTVTGAVAAAVDACCAARGERTGLVRLDAVLQAPTIHLDCVVVSHERRVEVVLDPGADASTIVPDVARLADDGWTVVVLMELEAIGAAHPALRGSPCTLQPWWLAADDVQFGAHEIP
jgi:hypothetical protein